MPTPQSTPDPAAASRHRDYVKYVPEDSVIRLPDGTIGTLTHQESAYDPWIAIRPGHPYAALDRHQVIEVLVTPTCLAYQWIHQHAGQLPPVQTPP